MTKNTDILEPIKRYYESFKEKDRLVSNRGQLEFVRSQEIIKRYLPKTPTIILDVGGGAGIYSLWLAKEGHIVHLVDPVRSHLDTAQKLSNQQSNNHIKSIGLGDARSLEQKDSSNDVVLLMGPLYHLIKREDRLKALREAYRVLKDDGLLFAVGISRFASTIDGMLKGYYFDPEFRKIFLKDLEDGHHRNHTNNPLYFTDTFFHHPEELREEIIKAGFKIENLIGIEGIAYLLKEYDDVWEKPIERNFLIGVLRKIENDPSLIGASPHIMCVARKSD